jgi:hypothetical protein
LRLSKGGRSWPLPLPLWLWQWKMTLRAGTFVFYMRLIEKKKCRIGWALLCLLLSKKKKM